MSLLQVLLAATYFDRHPVNGLVLAVLGFILALLFIRKMIIGLNAAIRGLDKEAISDKEPTDHAS